MILIIFFSVGALRGENYVVRDKLKELCAKTLQVVSTQNMLPKMYTNILDEGKEKHQQFIDLSIYWMSSFLERGGG